MCCLYTQERYTVYIQEKYVLLVYATTATFNIGTEMDEALG